MVSVYLCDDVPELRRLMRLILEEDPALCVIGEADEAKTGIEEIAELQPDVVVLDLSMPGMDGLEALPIIRQTSPDTRVIVFSGFTKERKEALALDRGAHRYIEKGEPLEHVKQAVHELQPH